MALLKAALEEQDGLFGMLLQQNGRCGTTAPLVSIDAHSAVAPLLQVETAMHMDRDAIWVDVTCVGRLSIDDMDIAHDLPYDRAFVSSFADEPEHDVPMDVPRGMDDWMEILETREETHVHEAHQACYTLAAKIKALKGGDSFGGARPCADCPQAPTCHLSGEFSFSLPILIGARREVLLRRSRTSTEVAGSAPAPGGGLAPGAAVDKARLERQILSFAACSDLSPKARRRAMRTRGTTERLALAASELREKQLELCAELALRSIFSSSSDSA